MAKKMKNRGLHQYRFKDNPEERRFAEAWEAENVRPNNITTMLNQMLGDGTMEGTHYSTPREVEVAATVIQWLGSQCGQFFLKELGYSKATSLGEAGLALLKKRNPDSYEELMELARKAIRRRAR